ncbi:MAG: lipid-A-disaccharide synthase [Waddliaceae bacterium]
MKSLFIMAGEKSGDLLGGMLALSLKEKFPNHVLQGVAGATMRDNGVEAVMRAEDFEVMGFSDLIKSLRKMVKRLKQVQDHILLTQPDAVILIDYPGFNLRLASALKRSGYKGKVIQYVSPSVWAWGKGRIEKMEHCLDHLLTILPFEKKLFEKTSLPVTYVGNPIAEIVEKHTYDPQWKRLFGIRESDHLIGLFPGSRRSEVLSNLPYQLKAAEQFKKKYPDAVFAISCAHEQVIPSMHQMLEGKSLIINENIFLLPKSYSYELMKDCKSAIAKSGSVTLELALHSCPSVVMYKLNLFNKLIAKYFLRLNLPYYCIVNILMEDSVFPELIAKGLSPKNILRNLEELHEDTDSRKICIEKCKTLRSKLKDKVASIEAAQTIFELI